MLFDPHLHATEEMQHVTNVFYVSFTLWREARSEPRDGKIAVVYSILDRVASPKWWGRDVPTIVSKAWQYSSLTDPNDPQLVKYPVYDDSWVECLSVTLDVFSGRVANPVPGADSYYATWMDRKVNPKTGRYMTPPWALANTSKFVAQIGGHKFYNTDGNHPANTKEP